MQLQWCDYNNVAVFLSRSLSAQWNTLQSILQALPLHLKASDQEGIQGAPIFDPVGTNEAIKASLRGSPGWLCNVPIPPAFQFLGTDVDFVNGSLLVEAQFSNYPFLLNNLLRSELFHGGKVQLAGQHIEAVIIITKARMFPASNSTLYYEQAQNQLSALAANNVFDVPIRLVGLFVPPGACTAVWTTYASSRYSRTVSAREQREFQVSLARPGARARITR